MDVFNQINSAQTEQELQQAIDHWFYFGDQNQDAEYVIPHIVEHLNKINEYSHYLQNTGIEQNVLHHLSNAINEVGRVMAHIVDNVERNKEEKEEARQQTQGLIYEDIDDEELKRMVIDRLHSAIR